MIRPLPLLAPALALLASGCAYDSYASGYAPRYPAGYAPVAAPGIAWASQPGDLFGGQDVADVNVFVQPLSPYGRWVQTGWGLAFAPNAPAGWRPYVNGRWGPDRFWISADPWGWATDHYGRWGYDQTLGWVWVPGTEWGPSWVAWREADDVYGWAPIPPRVTWTVGIGFGAGWGWNDWNSWYGPSWVWVPRTYAFVPGFGGHVLPWNAGFNYWRGSRWNNGWGWGGGRPGWNNGWAPGAYAPYGWGWNRSWQNRWQGNRGGNWGSPPRGAPGSVGDQIGRGIAGLPPATPRPGWNNGGRWNGNPNGSWANPGNGWQRPPQAGAPGSVGDQIGRGMTGRPPAANNGGNWAGGNRGWGGGDRGNGGRGNGGRGNGGRRGIADDGSSGAIAQPLPNPMQAPPMAPQLPPQVTSAAPPASGPSAMPAPGWGGNRGGGWRGNGGSFAGGGGWRSDGSSPPGMAAPAAAPRFEQPRYQQPAMASPPRPEPPAYRPAPAWREPSPQRHERPE